VFGKEMRHADMVGMAMSEQDVFDSAHSQSRLQDLEVVIWAAINLMKLSDPQGRPCANVLASTVAYLIAC